MTIVTLRARNAAGNLSPAAQVTIAWTGATTAALLGHWDSFPDRAGASPSNYSANAGVDQAMQVLGGRGSQIMHTYPGRWETTYGSSSVAKSSEFGNAFLVNMASPGAYAAVTAGTFDAQFRAWFNSPPTSQACYVTMDSEPDNSSKGTDPTAWSKAMGHIVNVAAPIMDARGLVGGVGGLLMGSDFSPKGLNNPALFGTWNWLQYVDPSAMHRAVYMLDVYSKYLDDQALTYESIPAICEVAFSQARKLGCTRFGIGEFANSREKRNAGGQIVGTSATQQKWITTEIPKIRAIQGLEFAIYFAKPGGPESKNAELLDDATGKPLTAYAQII